MTTYRARVTMPEVISDWFTAVNEVAKVISIEPSTGQVVIEIVLHDDDLYELAEAVNDLKSTLASTGPCEATDITRPVEV